MSVTAAAVGAEILIPILKRAGAPILKKLIERRIGGKGAEIANTAIDVIADKLGVAPTPQRIAEEHAADPERVEAVIADIESESPETWLAYLDLLSTDAKSDDAWQRRWRPATALLFAAACTALMLTVCWAILAQIPIDESQMPLIGMVGTVIVPWAGVVGWYVKTRSDEKIARAA